MTSRLGLCLLLLATVAAGCATRPETIPLERSESGWDMRRDALLETREWDFYGRVSVTVEEQGWHANLGWQQRGSGYELDLSGPLNQGRLLIVGSPQGVRAQAGDGSVVTASDAQSLIEQQLGWSLPVEGMRYWVRGVPDPGLPVDSMSLDELGRLASLSQGGWSIRYPSYLEGEGLDLPRKILLDSPRASIRMVIDEWVETRSMSLRKPHLRDPSGSRGGFPRPA